MHSQEFIQEALKQYASLPQEISELYKRHYIALPDINLADGAAPVYASASDLPIKFDITVQGAAVHSSSHFVKPLKTNELSSEIITNKLHSNDEDKFVAFIHSHAANTLLIEVPEGQSAELKILLDNAAPSQIIINAHQNSSLIISEYFVSGYTSPATASAILQEVTLLNGANVEINAIHNEDSNSIVLGFCKNRTEQDASFRFNSVYTGGSHVRVRNTIAAQAPNSKVHVSETVLGSDQQKFDILTSIVNGAPDTNATLESRAALMDTSMCMLKGFAKITYGSKRARSYVREAVMLLDKGARGIALPDMSIDENDVKATHAALAGPVDPEQLFYMETRGIAQHSAKNILTTAFIGESLASISNPLFRELAMATVTEKLRSRSIGGALEINTVGLWRGDTTNAANADPFRGHYKYRGV